MLSEKDFGLDSTMAPDRRNSDSSATEPFPHDHTPTPEELATNIGKLFQTDFFRSRGPLFTACFFLYDYATSEGAKGRSSVVRDEDLRDRLSIFRIDDISKVIARARSWYQESYEDKAS